MPFKINIGTKNGKTYKLEPEAKSIEGLLTNTLKNKKTTNRKIIKFLLLNSSISLCLE